MPLLSRKTVLAAKVESTAGTAETLTATEAAMNIYNPTVEDDNGMIQRPGAIGFGQLQAVPAGRKRRIRFETDLVGGAAVPLWATTLLPMCGLTNSSGTFTFNTAVTPGSISLYADGIVVKIAGATGTFEINLNAGAAGRVAFDFLGKTIADADATLLVPTLPTVVPPRWVNNAVTIAGVTPLVSTCTITAGNEMIMREDATDTTKAGYLSGYITDRNPTMTMDPEAVTVATKDWNALLLASTESSFSIAVGDTAQNIITIAGSKAQVVNAPIGDRNKMVTRQLETQLNGSSPFTIVFS